jgi:hypothetical protein
MFVERPDQAEPDNPKCSEPKCSECGKEVPTIQYADTRGQIYCSPSCWEGQELSA